MESKSGSTVRTSGSVGSAATSEKGTAARLATQERFAKLTGQQKWAIAKIRNARAALKVAQEAVLNGENPAQGLIPACLAIETATAEGMFKG